MRIKFKDKINKLVLDKTGFDVPQLDGNNKLSRKEILEILRRQCDWYDDFAQECRRNVETIIKNNFTLDERCGD